MSLLTAIYCQCDVCGERSSGFDGAIYSRLDVWQILHQGGWTRRQLPTDTGLTHKCPSCGTTGPTAKVVAA